MEGLIWGAWSRGHGRVRREQRSSVCSRR